jgi:hypothetical protein
MMKREDMPARSRTLEIASVVAAIGALACAGASHGLPLTAVGPAGWTAQLEEAIAVWNDAAGCTAFELGEGVAVTLYESGWPGAANERGYWDGIEVAVRETTPEVERATLVHELGHVAGLPHSDEYESVMYPIVGARYLPSPDEASLVGMVLCGE